MNGEQSGLDMAQGLKTLFFKHLSVAAEAATYRDDLWDRFDLN
jgi:hypothetical protein